MNSEARGNAGAVAWQSFWLPKRGASEGEYEDAVAFSEKEEAPPFRVAVADGATETAFSRPWARLLAHAFAARGRSVLEEGLPQVQGEWRASIESRSGALPWYAAEKIETGAFAALLGLELRTGPDGHAWQALAVGDCNVFHLREGERVKAWPRTRAEDFDDRPALVSSRSGASLPEARHVTGTYQRGDAFVLATDAAAAWLLQTTPAEALRWSDQAAFGEAVRTARAGGTLKNDDTTVAVLQVK